MRPGLKKIVSHMSLLLAVTWLYSCGSSDLLDEPNQRYRASIAVKDNGTETPNVDIIQSWCDTEPEDYGPATAAVSIAVDANAPGITLEEYVLEYIPLESEDGTGTIVMPPVLDGPLRGGNFAIDIESGGSATFDITCMSTDTKEEYRTKVGWLYYSETAEGLAIIAAKEDAVIAKDAEIDAKKAEITVKEDEITAATVAQTDTALLTIQLASLEEDLTDLEDELEVLETELAELPFTFFSVPELVEGRYKIRITFKFEDEFGVDRDIVREATVWLGYYNNC